MLNNHGYAGVQWESAKAEAKELLIAIAKQKGRVAYSELANQIRSISIDAHDPRMFHLLGEISVEEDKAGRGMLTAIVVHKHGDMQPGPGFFELAKSLGRNTNDPLACWITEFNKVHGYWSKK